MRECHFLVPLEKIAVGAPDLEAKLLGLCGGFTGPEHVGGAWLSPQGRVVREYSVRYIVATDDPAALVSFLGGLCKTLGEECIYFSNGGEVTLIPPSTEVA